MGWSYSAKAGFVLDAIRTLVGGASSNAMPGGGFYETSRTDHPDGAITGSVWRPLNAAEKAKWAHLDRIDERVKRAGSFRISGDGKVVRFPRLPRELIAKAEAIAAAEYKRVYGG